HRGNLRPHPLRPTRHRAGQVDPLLESRFLEVLREDDPQPAREPSLTHPTRLPISAITCPSLTRNTGSDTPGGSSSSRGAVTNTWRPPSGGGAIRSASRSCRSR